MRLCATRCYLGSLATQALCCLMTFHQGLSRPASSSSVAQLALLLSLRQSFNPFEKNRVVYSYSENLAKKSPFQVHLSDRVLWTTAFLLTNPSNYGCRADVITCSAIATDFHNLPSRLRIQIQKYDTICLPQ